MSKQNDVSLLLDLIFVNRADYISQFLREFDLKVSGTKPELRSRILEALEAKVMSVEDLVELLNKIEGWGNSHIYLLSVGKESNREWRNENSVKRILKSTGMSNRLNASSHHILPEKAELSSIEWNPKRVRFVWIVGRSWEERDATQDEVRSSREMIMKAYHLRRTRGILAFDWDLITGEATLSIQRLPRGNAYTEIKNDTLNVMENFVPLANIATLKLSKAIKAIDSSNEVTVRHASHRTGGGSGAKFSSGSRKSDARKDRDIVAARTALGDRSQIENGNFYWKPVRGQLMESVHTVFYGSDNRIGIFGQHLEEDIRHVVSRIRFYCK